MHAHFIELSLELHVPIDHVWLLPIIAGCIGEVFEGDMRVSRQSITIRGSKEVSPWSEEIYTLLGS